MRLFSALLRLCLLYFVFTADKGFGKTADLSFSFSSSSSVIQEKTTTNGNELDTNSEDILTVVPFRDHMEKEDILKEKRSEDSVEDSPSKDVGSNNQRLSPACCRSVVAERDQLKQKLQKMEEERSFAQGDGRHHERSPIRVRRDIGSVKCPDFMESLTAFHSQRKCMTQDRAELQYTSIMEALNDVRGDVKELMKKLKASNCNELFKFGKKESGVYTIYPRRDEDEEEGVNVWCDMGEQYEEDEEGVTEEERGGGGWTVILKRKALDYQVNFSRGWDEYKEGFGDPETEYWIGNEVIHQLTSGGNPQQALRIDMEDWDGVRKFAFYGNFSVGGEVASFPLHVGAFSSNRSTVYGDSLNHVDSSGDYILNGMKFSTFDKDNDRWIGVNCALIIGGGGGFWYNECSHVKPTRPLLPKGQSGDGMYWLHFNNDYTHLQSLSMKIKPLHG